MTGIFSLIPRIVRAIYIMLKDREGVRLNHKAPFLLRFASGEPKQLKMS